MPSNKSLTYYGPHGKDKVERNRIYFVFDHGHDFGVFSTSDQSMERYTIPFLMDHYSTKLAAPVWFTPTPW